MPKLALASSNVHFYRHNDDNKLADVFAQTQESKIFRQQNSLQFYNLCNNIVFLAEMDCCTADYSSLYLRVVLHDVVKTEKIKLKN